jgi:hypothetical protein
MVRRSRVTAEIACISAGSAPALGVCPDHGCGGVATIEDLGEREFHPAHANTQAADKALESEAPSAP